MSILTRCPHCQTCFRVTDEQLKMASGKVRCGHCMGVFNARDARVEEKQPPREKPAAPAERPSAPKAPAPAPKEPPREEGDDLVFADNPEEDETEAGYSGTNAILEGDELSDTFLALDNEPEGQGDMDSEEEQEPVDESWAEQMLQDEATSQPKARPTPTREKPAQAGAPRNEPGEVTKTPPPAPPTEKDETGLSATDAQPPEPDEPPLTAGTRAEAPPEQSEKPDFRELRPEPLAVNTGKGRGWGRRILWLLLILGLLGVIVSQLAYFQFNRLSRVEMLRPLYEIGCRFAGCQLPPLVDVRKISSEKLVVRSDPNNPALLIVDAIIVNHARYNQPFPAIALTFANLNNDVVAQRVFHPDEYLKGDAQGMKAMPPETPFRIELRIKDPGQDAVNYNIEFLPEQGARPPSQ